MGGRLNQQAALHTDEVEFCTVTAACSWWEGYFLKLPQYPNTSDTTCMCRARLPKALVRASTLIKRHLLPTTIADIALGLVEPGSPDVRRARVLKVARDSNLDMNEMGG
jgi:hypothetical protein